MPTKKKSVSPHYAHKQQKGGLDLHSTTQKNPHTVETKGQNCPPFPCLAPLTAPTPMQAKPPYHAIKKKKATVPCLHGGDAHHQPQLG